MSLSKITLLAAGLALGLSTVGITTQANAQGAQNTPANMLGDIGDEDVIVIHPTTGKMMRMKSKGKGHHAKAMKMGAKEIKGGMIFRSGGKMYLLEDKAATKASAKSMIHEEFQEEFNEMGKFY